MNPLDAEDLRVRVHKALEDFLSRQADALEAVSPDCAPMLEASADLMRGGKRLRPAFCYWAWRGAGGVDSEPIVTASAALEFFQAAALIHDDVMDDSDTRRGRPAAHRVFADLHARNGWSGEPRRFGDASAILLGDLALVLSGQAFDDAVAGAPTHVQRRGRAVFDAMRAEVTVGQYLDALAQAMPWGQDPASDELRAREVIRAKSARYSVQHPIVLGAALADADDDALAACGAVGLPLGEAFQLRDDLLGVFGDPASTGKPAGDDLREGKRTVLVARAMARARAAGDASTADLLLDGLGRTDLTAADIAAMTTVLAASGAPAEVEALIGELAAPAFVALAALPLAEPGGAMLAALAHAAVDRHA